MGHTQTVLYTYVLCLKINTVHVVVFGKRIKTRVITQKGEKSGKECKFMLSFIPWQHGSLEVCRKSFSSSECIVPNKA